MVAFFGPALDYEFVIWLSGNRGSGFPEFIPWSAQKPPPCSRSQLQSTPLNPVPTPKEDTMKTTTLFAAIAMTLAASASAMAQEVSYDYPQPATSQKTRAEVVAEVRQAAANGTLRLSEGEISREAPFVAQRTRADVRAETLLAIASGELQQLNREVGDYPPAVRATVARTLTARK